MGVLSKFITQNNATGHVGPIFYTLDH